MFTHIRANSGASGNAATNSVTNPYWMTKINEKHSIYEALKCPERVSFIKYVKIILFQINSTLKIPENLLQKRHDVIYNPHGDININSLISRYSSNSASLPGSCR